MRSDMHRRSRDTRSARSSSGDRSHRCQSRRLITLSFEQPQVGARRGFVRDCNTCCLRRLHCHINRALPPYLAYNGWCRPLNYPYVFGTCRVCGASHFCGAICAVRRPSFQARISAKEARAGSNASNARRSTIMRCVWHRSQAVIAAVL